MQNKDQQSSNWIKKNKIILCKKMEHKVSLFDQGWNGTCYFGWLFWDLLTSGLEKCILDLLTINIEFKHFLYSYFIILIW